MANRKMGGKIDEPMLDPILGGYSDLFITNDNVCQNKQVLVSLHINKHSNCSSTSLLFSLPWYSRVWKWKKPLGNWKGFLVKAPLQRILWMTIVHVPRLKIKQEKLHDKWVQKKNTDLTCLRLKGLQGSGNPYLHIAQICHINWWHYWKGKNG